MFFWGERISRQATLHVYSILLLKKVRNKNQAEQYKKGANEYTRSDKLIFFHTSKNTRLIIPISRDKKVRAIRNPLIKTLETRRYSITRAHRRVSHARVYRAINDRSLSIHRYRATETPEVLLPSIGARLFIRVMKNDVTSTGRPDQQRDVSTVSRYTRGHARGVPFFSQKNIKQ